MLSLLFHCLNPVFSHICLHKNLTIMLLSLSTFPSSLPNSLPKEKGTSNTSFCTTVPPLSLIWLQMYLVWITGKKLDLQTHCLWHFETTRDKDTSEIERSALFYPSLVQIMQSTGQSRKGASCFCAKFDAQQGFVKRGEKLISRALEVRVCICNICTQNVDTKWNCMKRFKGRFIFFFRFNFELCIYAPWTIVFCFFLALPLFTLFPVLFSHLTAPPGCLVLMDGSIWPKPSRALR